MKKFIYTIVGASLLFSATSCSDFLDQSSPSEADVDFVFSDPTSARSALQQAYELWRGNAYVHSNGLFYDYVVAGSDIECQPESYTGMLGRWVPANFYGYTDGTYSTKGTANFSISSVGDMKTAWTYLYNIIAITNTLITNFESTESFDAMMQQGEPSELSQIYGEAVALRATCYYELMRFYGDVPHQLVSGAEVTGLASRSEIAEYHINKLIQVEPLMYRPGESSIDKTYMTRTYVQGLIGRIALLEGGYAVRRTDLGADFYKDAAGNTLTFDKVSESATMKCFYGRRTDWKKMYEIAKTYLASAVTNPGSVQLQTVDPRGGDGKTYDNPFQYVFQQMNDLELATENVYEIPESRGVGQERPYAFGRPSNGGGSNSFPNKSYGQSRFNPIYYYDDFEPADKRRDVTCTVTGSTGEGAETLIPFTKGSVAKNGGIANNKWDENRMANPWTASSRKAGINCPYMRFSDLILLLAEVKATLGEADAKTYLSQVRERAFGSPAAANVDGLIARCGSVLDAVLEERKLEFGGEGQRRYDMIRTNTLDKAIKSFHSRTSAMIDDLNSKGYHQFDNGNVISNYVWVKLVNPADYGVGYRLTTTCTDRTNPVLWPAWRGQNDDWARVAQSNGTPTTNLKAGVNTNLAIKGLFEYIDPNGAEAKELEANGWERKDWGVTICELHDQYNELIFNGYSENEPPIYLCAIHADVIKNANGALSNGYGFKQE